MKIIKVFTKEVETIDDIICNKCGKSCKCLDNNFNGLIEASVVGAYDSTHLEDYTTYTFSLCEECLVNLFKTFEIAPLKEGYTI